MMLSKFGIRFTLHKEVEMQLLPRTLRRRVPPLYSSVEDPDPMVVIRFYAPWNNWAWYVVEGERDESHDFFLSGWIVGWVDDERAPRSLEEFDQRSRAGGHFLTDAELDEFAQEKNLDCFFLSELKDIRGPEGQRVMRDDSFTPCRLSEVRRMYAKGGIYEGQLFVPSSQDDVLITG